MLDIELDELEAILSTEARSSNAPKYATLQRAFETCIRSGHFKPGTRVPTEVELTRRLPVGLGTVQRALSGLAQRGLLVRSRKTGTFVADCFQTSETHVYRFKNPASGEYLLPFTQVLRVAPDRTAGPWRSAFPRKRLVRVDRLVWVADDPPAFSSVYLTYAHGRHLLDTPIEQLHGSSWHRLLSERYHLPTLRMKHGFSCQQLGDYACRQLGLPQGTYGSIWDILDFSFDEQPVLFQRYQLPPGHRPIELDEQKT
ncbi:MAG: GntR family transcriptional regulator [Alphaproteobacteria bacterium]|nr:GntR family transcriptional regulator [Alphaproteobacteria bacterium]